MKNCSRFYTSITVFILFCIFTCGVNGQKQGEEQCAVDPTDTVEAARPADDAVPPATGMDPDSPLDDDPLGTNEGEGERPAPPPVDSKPDTGRDSGPKYKRPKDFDLESALSQTALMLSVQHGTRLFQAKTYRELDGPFFKDWWRSVKGLQGWRDGDNNFTNYFAHPLQGSVTGRIYIANSRKARNAEFGKSETYWKTRLTAFAWSALWSAQFEMGPISEATIGNVGLRRKNGYSTMAWVDLVMTPTAGTGIVIAEDYIEKKLLKKMLANRNGKADTKLKILRSFLTPSMSVQNLLRFRVPWKRDPPDYLVDVTNDDSSNDRH